MDLPKETEDEQEVEKSSALPNISQDLESLPNRPTEECCSMDTADGEQNFKAVEVADGVAGTATDGVTGTASDGVAGTASDGAAGTASDGVAGTVSDEVAGTATDEVAGTVSDEVAGTSSDGVAGTATDEVAGTASDGVAGTATDEVAVTATLHVDDEHVSPEYEDQQQLSVIEREDDSSTACNQSVADNIIPALSTSEVVAQSNQKESEGHIIGPSVDDEHDRPKHSESSESSKDQESCSSDRTVSNLAQEIAHPPETASDTGDVSAAQFLQVSSVTENSAKEPVCSESMKKNSNTSDVETLVQQNEKHGEDENTEAKTCEESSALSSETVINGQVEKAEEVHADSSQALSKNQTMQELDTGEKAKPSEDTKTNGEKTEDDDDIIVVSQSVKDGNKKASLATLFKCVRCGHYSNSRTELNKHLLQMHKLIIVSKQKSVDCLFCSRKLEMKDFHQHLKSEHKVLLVRSQSQNSKPGGSASDASSKQKTSSSSQLIDLTCEDEAGAKAKVSTAKQNDTNKSTVDKRTKPASHQSPKPASHTASQSIALRRTPRKISARKYTECESESSTSETEDAGAIDNDVDDEDYNPITDTNTSSIKSHTDLSRGKVAQSNVMKSSTVALTKATTETSGKTVHLSVGKPPATSVTSIAPASRGVTAAPLNALRPSFTSTASSGVIASSTSPAQQNTLNVLKNLKAHQRVKFNGQVYNVTESGGIKYLIPMSVSSSTIQPVPTVTTTAPPPAPPPVVPQVQNIAAVPGGGNLLLQSGNQVLSLPQTNILQPGLAQQPLILSSPALQQGQTLIFTIPQGQLQNVNTPLFQPALQPAIQMTPQPTIFPTTQPTIHPTTQPTIPPTTKPTIHATTQPNIHPNTQPTIQSNPVLTAASAALIQNNTLTSQTQSTFSADTVKSVPAVSSPIVLTTQTSATSVTSTARTLISTVSIAASKPVSLAGSSARSLPISTPKSVPTATSLTKPNTGDLAGPVKLKETSKSSVQVVNIAKPRNVKTSNLYKAGGLFALEVCLNTATQPGTEPQKEPRVAYMIQEKETVFEEPPEKETSGSDVSDLVDSEKSKSVVAAAIARGHITPSDLSSLSDKAQFECMRCNSCFPQHLLLSLHVRHCSKLAPSCTPETKVHCPLAVLDEFFKDPPGARSLYIYCRFCRARILRTVHDHSVTLAHFVKHIEPKVEITILPKNNEVNMKNQTECTSKALEWVDYIVPPFTLENPPTSSKSGLLDQFVSTQLQFSAFKKKKKKKKKHKHKNRGSDSDDEEQIGSRLSSLRAKTARYLGSLRPKEASSQEVMTNASGNSSASNFTGNRLCGGRTMMRSFKLIRSPNKLGSTLTAFIPVKQKHKDKGKQGYNAKQWNNGKTRSQHVHWRRQSRRFSAIRDRDTSTPDDSTPDGSVIHVSSDEEDSGAIAVPIEEAIASSKLTSDSAKVPNTSGNAYPLTEDDFSDYLRLINDAEELQICPKAPVPISPKAGGDQSEAASDLLDYYGNDIDSSLTCEPLIMEPEQVVCYFKGSNYNKMICQFRDCDSEVPKNIRSMLAHIRVHFQILVPLQLLAKCNTQIPRQSIPRALRLTFSQVQAHFTIADMQEANLHLGEVQQLYTCMWKNCARSRCYKKNICAHLLKHILFTLITKEDYQAMAKTMSAYSPVAEDSAVKKLRIVAMNKSGEKIAVVITIPASQAESPEGLKAAIKKSLAGDASLKLPANVLTSIVQKFASAQSKDTKETGGNAPLMSKTGQTRGDKEGETAAFLTEAELDGLRQKFPSLLAKLNLPIVIQGSAAEGSTQEGSKEEDRAEWTPMIDDVKSRTGTDPHIQDSTRKPKQASRRTRKVALPRWKTLLRRKVPLWDVNTKSKSENLQLVTRTKITEERIHGTKRKGNQIEVTNEQPLSKREKTNSDDKMDDDHILESNPVLDTVQHSSECDQKTTSAEAFADKESLDRSEQNILLGDATPNKADDEAACSETLHLEECANGHNTNSVRNEESVQSSDLVKDIVPEEIGGCKSDDKVNQCVPDIEHLADGDKKHCPTDSLEPVVSRHDGTSSKTGEPRTLSDANVPVEAEQQSDEIIPNSNETATEHEEDHTHMTTLTKGSVSDSSSTGPPGHVEHTSSGTVSSGQGNTGSTKNVKASRLQKAVKTSLVFGLSAIHIVKAFRFQRAQKNRRVKVSGRGCGAGVFRCKMAHCNFFQEVMTKDEKAGILRALALHFIEAHMRKFKHRTFVLHPNPKSVLSLSNTKFLQLFKDQSFAEDFKKIKLQDKFQQIPPKRARLASIDGRRVRIKVQRFVTCISRTCLFGCFNPSRTVLISHLRAHLHQAQLKDKTKDRDLQSSEERSTLDENILGDGQSKAESTPTMDSGSDDKDRISPLHHDATETLSSGTPPADALSAEPTEGSAGSFDPKDVMDTEEPESRHPEDDQPSLSPGTGTLDSPVEHVKQEGKEADEAMEVCEEEHLPGGTENRGCEHVAEEVASENAPEKSKVDEEVLDASTRENGTESFDDAGLETADANDEPSVPPTDKEGVMSLEHTNDGRSRSPLHDDVEKMETGESETDEFMRTMVSSSSPDSYSSPTKDMDELANRPEDPVEMFYDELQSYFACYTAKISQTRDFGIKCFSCPKCEKSGLRGEYLPKHLESHIGKAVSVTSVDNINADFPSELTPGESGTQSQDDRMSPELSGVTIPAETSVDIRHDNSACEGKTCDEVKAGCEESDTVLRITEEEILKRFFTKDMSINAEAPVPFGREVLKCRICQYSSMTILDAPHHIEQHVKKTVILRK